MTALAGTPFDPGRALWNQRHNVKAALPRLQSFQEAILSFGSMAMLPEDYATVFATVLEFQPDLVIEVGRLFGNTTCILTEAVQSVPGASVLSLCLTDHWKRSTLPLIRPLVSAQWLGKLDARVMDVLELDVEATLRGKRRVFFLLDAHGWDVAEYVVGVVVPELFKREHLLFMHDVVLPTHYAAVYAKYFPHDPTRPTDGMEGYGGRGIWRGSEETWDRFLFLNGLAGRYPEFVAFVDFANRNGLTLHALETSVRQAIEDYPERREEMQRLLGDRMYAPFSAFAWLSLDLLDRPTQLRFPTFRRPGSSARIAEELRVDLRRNRIAGMPSPLTLARIFAKAMLGRYTERA